MQTLLSLMENVISVDQRWYRMHVTSPLAIVNDHYYEPVLSVHDVELVGVSKWTYEACQEVEKYQPGVNWN